MLASLVEALVDAFNWNLELGIRRGRGVPCDQSEKRATKVVREEAPPWTKNVTGVQEPLNLINWGSEPHARADETFLKRNVEATTGYSYTV